MTEPSPRETFLRKYEQEHATTMKVLRAYPPEQAELRPHPKLKTARERSWIFVLERGLGEHIFRDAFANGIVSGEAQPAPAKWEDVISALEQAHQQFATVFQSFTDEELKEQVSFFSGPGVLGKFSRLEIAWFLLHDQIHHRGQLSVYLRMAGGKVPSIYGPSGD